MGQVRLLASAGAVALLVFVIALVPARVAFGWLGLPPGAASGFSGSLWSGSAERLAVDGFVLGPIHWTARPFHLMTGQVAADVEAVLPDGFVNGTFGLGLGGKISISGLEAAAPLSWLAPAAGGGQVTARFDSLSIETGRVETAIGKLDVAGVVLPIPTAGPQLGPGTYAITFNAQGLSADEPLTGQLSDAGGPLEIAGTVTFTPPRAYELTGKAKPRGEAPPELRNALQMLGPATPDGAHELTVAGTF